MSSFDPFVHMKSRSGSAVAAEPDPPPPSRAEMFLGFAHSESGQVTNEIDDLASKVEWARESGERDPDDLVGWILGLAAHSREVADLLERAAKEAGG